MYKTGCFLQEWMKKSLFTAVELLALAIVLAIGTSSTAIVSATDKSDDNPGKRDTQSDRVGSDDNDQQTSDVSEGADQDGTTTDPTSAGNDGTIDTDTNTNTVDATTTQEVAAASDNRQENSNGDTQPGRVGSHDSQTSGEGADAGGTVSDSTVPADELGDGVITSNCFGKVISHEAQEHKTDPDEGTLGEHSRDPVPGDGDNETPRQGIGNQDQGHPAAHGAFNSQFDPDDAENVAENC
jgi:hypothetical protein